MYKITAENEHHDRQITEIVRRFIVARRNLNWTDKDVASGAIDRDLNLKFAKEAIFYAQHHLFSPRISELLQVNSKQVEEIRSLRRQIEALNIALLALTPTQESDSVETYKPYYQPPV